MKDEALQLEAARQVKARAKEIFSQFGSVNGIGLTRLGDGYAVKVNFESEPLDRANLPHDIEGVPVVIQVIGPLHKQAARQRRAS